MNILTIRGVIGGIILFLGHELNFLFAAGMAALIGFRLTPKLPPQWPAWSDWAFMLVLAIIAATLVLLSERAGYFISGFLAGGYLLIEYFAPGVLTVPILPFMVGGVLGAAIIGFLTEWAMILVSSAIGAVYLLNLFVLSPTAEILIGAGMFIVGALVQVITLQARKHAGE